MDRVPITSSFIIKPKMVYPLPSLKAQVIVMYRNWNEEMGLYTDIYDGEIWKTFPS